MRKNGKGFEENTGMEGKRIIFPSSPGKRVMPRVSLIKWQMYENRVIVTNLTC